MWEKTATLAWRELEKPQNVIFRVADHGRDMNSAPAKYKAELIGIAQMLIGLHAGTDSSEERASAIFRDIIW